ncbi:MAG: N-acetylneuraminate synthase family protein [archaeon]|nr:N-acetylneuraminate synthase [Euryarchaeota archaeon]MDP7260357.1 N-acetylneuraminate synthase family protein [archaeon]
MIKIRDRELGTEKPVYIIAEAGVNHNGSIELAKKLVDAAAEAGADAVKFQTFRAELIVTEDADKAEYQKKDSDESQFNMLRNLELSDEDFMELKEYCNTKKVEFLSTPHSGEWSVNLLEELGISAYKIGSGDLTNIPLLKYIAKLGKPVIISTGMATLDEIEEAKESINSEGNDNLIVLHCTTMYPCPEGKVNLRAMQTILEKTENLVGYSDHTNSIEASIIATCLGASLIEKHFTLDQDMPGPDHASSIEPDELEELIRAIRFVRKNNIQNPSEAFDALNSQGYSLNSSLIETILGSPEKVPDEKELEISKVARKSIVARKYIKSGEELTSKNIGILRPGEGLHPRHFPELLGKQVVRDIKKNEYLLLEDVK